MAVELLGDAAPVPIRDEIARSVAELDQLVGEVLLASRLDTATAPEHPFVMGDLTALAAEECARMQADCEAEMMAISGDPTLLRRMIRNLLENAQRHGDGTRGHRLGLSLVRQIARRHGGDVAYLPRPAGGGCFRVTLSRGAA